VGFLTGGDYDEWVKAFSDGFTDFDALATVVRSSQERSLEQLVARDALEKVIPRLIQVADDAGWASALARKALEARPKNAKLLRVVERLDIREALDDPDPYLAIRMVGQPMLDREALRATVAKLEGDETPRVFVVDGDRFSGKTYTIQFLSFIAMRRKTFKVVTVDLERRSKLSNGPICPDSIAQSIVTSLALPRDDVDRMPLLAEEQESRYVLEFSEWLIGVLGRTDMRHCIVIDHFKKALLTQGSADLVIELSRRAFETANLVVVLLEYEQGTDLGTTLGRLIDHQRIPSLDPEIMRRDLTRFFTAVYSERETLGGSMPTDGIRSLAVTAAQNVLAQLPEGEERLPQLRLAIDLELRRNDTVPAIPPAPPVAPVPGG
jgi:hypothetical protein